MSNKKRILVLNWWDIRNPKAGGAEVHLNEIFSRLAKKGFQITLLCSKFSGGLSQENFNGINIIRRGPFWLINFYSFFWYLKNKDRFDIVIDYTNKIPYLTPLYVKDKPIIAIAHHVFGEIWTYEWGIIGSIFSKIEKVLYKKYQNCRIVSVSESTKGELIKIGINRNNISVIYNGISSNYHPTAKAMKPLGIYLGRLKKYKRIELILRALSKIDLDYNFYIIGIGNDSKRLKRISQAYDLEDRVKFKGFVSEDSKIKYLGQAWFLVQPSIKEGWGFTVLEAARCGTPSIVANVSGLKETIIKNLSGWYFDNETQLQSRIKHQFLNKKNCQNFGKGARSFSRQFQWTKALKLFHSELDKLI